MYMDFLMSCIFIIIHVILESNILFICFRITQSNLMSGADLEIFQTLKGGGGNALCPILQLSPLLEINFKEANTRSLMTKCERI